MRRIVLIVLLATCLLGVNLVAGAPAPASTDGAAPASPDQHPRLLFGEGDVEGLRTKVLTGVPAGLWAVLKAKADRYLDRTDVRYVDPADQHTGEQNAQGTFLTDLSFAYLISGDERYGRHAIEMMLEGAAQGWPAWSNNELGRGGVTKGVAFAFDWAYDLMRPAEREAIVASLVSALPTLNSAGEPRNGVYENKVFSCLDLDHPWLPTSTHNWNGVCGGGNGLALLAIEGEDGVPDLTPWMNVARDHVLRYFKRAFGALGDGNEGHTYSAYGLHQSLPFALSLRDLKGEDLVGQAPQVRNVVEWLAYEQLPVGGSRLIPRNDAATPNPLLAEVLPFFFELRPGDGLTGWLWDHTVGADGDDITVMSDHEVDNALWPGDPSCAIPVAHADEAVAWTLFCARSSEVYNIIFHRSATDLPRTSPGDVLPNSRHYSEYGLVNVRTGWDGPNELAMTLEAKRRANGHSQIDAGNFTIYGNGGMFAVDSGYGHNFSCRNNLVAQLLLGCTNTDPMIDNGRASGHNVVLVDNSKHSQNCCWRLGEADLFSGFLAGATSTVARTDLRSVYRTVTARSEWADRDFLVRQAPGDPVVVVVADRMRRSASTHTYQWTMHSDAANVFTTDGSAFRLEAPSGAVLAGATSDAHGPTAVFGEPWDATRYMANPPLVHNIVKSTTLLQRDFDHLAMLGVTKPGGAEAKVTSVAASGGTMAVASWPGGEVLVASKAHESPVMSSARLETDGDVAMVTPGEGETTLVAGSSLVADGHSYVSVSGGEGTVVAGGGTVEATGPSNAVFRVYAPEPVETVSLNGAPVTFGRDGDDVVFPASVPQLVSLALSPDPAGEGDVVHASAVFSSPTLAITSCTVDYGDGRGPVGGVVSGSTCAGPGHAYADDGSYTVTARATNSVGQGSGSAVKAIENRAPVVSPATVAADASGHFATASAPFTDAGRADGPFSCTVDYGDGAGPLPATVSDGQCTGATHLYRRPATYVITVRVRDKDGGIGTSATSYTVR